MKVVQAVVAGIVVVSLCGAAFAADGEGKAPREHRGPSGADRFAAMDTDGDGAISLDEFTVAHKKRVDEMKARMGDKWDEERAAKRPGPEEMFKQIDKDNNGKATKEEMAAHRKAMMENFRGRRGGPRGEGEGRRGGHGKPEADGDKL